MVTNKELEDLKKTLESDCIDDSEELLVWLVCNGPEIIDEILEWRRKFFLR